MYGVFLHYNHPVALMHFWFICRYNIQYGKHNSADIDVISAAKNADIHNKILTFPDAYDTQVSIH